MTGPVVGHRTLGSGAAALGVPAIGLGCMGMSDFYGPGDDTASTVVLHRAIDLGVTFLDTSDMYGPFTNEVLLGRAVAGHRDRVQLATKFGVVRSTDGGRSRIDGRPEHVRASCEASLRRLGVEVIDLYYQHRIDPTVPVEETVGAMSALVTEGKVRFLGLSEAAPATIRRAHATHPLTAVQTEYSLFTRDLEDDVLPVLRELGIGLVPYSPLGRGLLTGTQEWTSEGDGRATPTFPRFQGEALAANLTLVEKVRALARGKGCTPGQLALAWVLAQGDDLVPIPGTKRVAHLEENVAATDVVLTDEDLAALAAAVPRGAVQGARYRDMSSLNR